MVHIHTDPKICPGADPTCATHAGIKDFLTCLSFFHQRNLCIILKTVFTLTGMMRSKRPWYGAFGLTTQLWIAFFLMAISNVLAVIAVGDYTWPPDRLRSSMQALGYMICWRQISAPTSMNVTGTSRQFCLAAQLIHIMRDSLPLSGLFDPVWHTIMRSTFSSRRWHI